MVDRVCEWIHLCWLAGVPHDKIAIPKGMRTDQWREIVRKRYAFLDEQLRKCEPLNIFGHYDRR